MTAGELVRSAGADWQELSRHPFITATADGSLPAEVFDRWLIADHCYVVGFRRFLADLIVAAPDEAARDLLAGALAPLAAELALFREALRARGLDPSELTDPGPVALGYTSFLLAAPRDGFAVATAVLYGAEKAYFDAWSAVRATANTSSPYWSFIDNWSSPDFGAWVDDVAGLLDRVSPDGPTPAQRWAFDRVVRLERLFWDAVWRGESW